MWQRAPPQVGRPGVIICRRVYLQAASPAHFLLPFSTAAYRHSTPAQRPLNGHCRPAGPICAWNTQRRPICRHSVIPDMAPSALTQTGTRGREESRSMDNVIITRVCINAVQLACLTIFTVVYPLCIELVIPLISDVFNLRK